MSTSGSLSTSRRPTSWAMTQLGALVALVVLAPQLLGGVFPWSIAIICGVASVTAFVASLDRARAHTDSTPMQLLDWAVVLAFAWTALQLVPLPRSLVSSLVPETVEAWASADALLGRTPREWIPLSLDPGATLFELAKGSAILAAYFVARHYSGSGRRAWVLGAVGASGAWMALVALGHRLANAEEVFGLYRPVYAGTRLLAPLMNENHLGGFMALTTPILLGLTIDARRREVQVAAAVATLCCAVSGILTFSRGGIGALGLGLGAFVAFGIVRSWRAGAGRSAGPWGAVAVTLLVGIALIGTLAGDDLRREFMPSQARTPKLAAAEAAIPLITSHWLTGVGRGAFSVAFVGEYGAAKRFVYPENILAQWTSEWGLIIGLSLLVLVVVSLTRGGVQSKTWAALGAVLGLAALGVQQLVDFSLELLGVAVVAAAALGSVAVSRSTGPRVSLRTALRTSAAFAFAGALLATSLRGTDTLSLERGITTALETKDLDAARALVVEGMSLHPAEPTFTLVGAELALRAESPDTGRWINAAQRLAPRWSAPHLLAARWLLVLGNDDQALVELRAGERKHPGSMVQLICRLLEDQPEIEIVLRVTPRNDQGGRFLDRVAACLPWSTPLAARIDAEALTRDSSLEGPTLRQARRLTKAGDDQAVIELLEGVAPRGVSATILLAEAHLRTGDDAEAKALLDPLLESTMPPDRALRAAIALAVADGQNERVQALAAQLRARTNGKNERLADLELYLGKLYEDAGRPRLALASYRNANRLIESRQSLEAVARTSKATGDRIGAILAYRKLCRKNGGTGAACDIVRAEEAGAPAPP